MELQLNWPILMADIVKILLFKDEIDLACYLNSFYEIQCDELMIEHAIQHDYLKWLKFLWTLGKNRITFEKGK